MFFLDKLACHKDKSSNQNMEIKLLFGLQKMFGQWGLWPEPRFREPCLSIMPPNACPWTLPRTSTPNRLTLTADLCWSRMQTFTLYKWGTPATQWLFTTSTSHNRLICCGISWIMIVKQPSVCLTSCMCLYLSDNNICHWQLWRKWLKSQIKINNNESGITQVAQNDTRRNRVSPLCALLHTKLVEWCHVGWPTIWHN